MRFVREKQAMTPGSGGDLRSRQIEELLVAARHELLDLDNAVLPPASRRERIRRRRTMKALSRRADVADCGSPFANKKLAGSFLKAGDWLDGLEGISGLLWERTQRHGAMLAARDRGISVVALAHNLESLVAGQALLYCEGGDAHTRFRAECQQLALADLRVVISARDQWLLSLFGLDSLLLPYRPPAERRLWLEEIRRRRDGARPLKRILIMGSAYYEPTFVGMHQLIKILSDSPLTSDGWQIDVMGFGSERLADVAQRPGVALRGTLSHEQLGAQLEQTAVAVVYQESGSGALTRVPEYLIAGVPVLANAAAARSYEHLSGVSIFFSDEELLRRIANIDLSAQPAAPMVEEALERAVLEAIASVVASRR